MAPVASDRGRIPGTHSPASPVLWCEGPGCRVALTSRAFIHNRYEESMTFRYQRPACPRLGLRLQDRDRAVLLALADHRYLLARHVHALLFSASSRRVCQQRLRLLFDHGFVERLARPAVRGSVATLGALAEPVYALSAAGARAVAEATGRTLSEIPSASAGTIPGWQTLDHDLVVAELLVALQVVCRARDDIRLEWIASEFTLRRQVAMVAVASRDQGDQIVPDGAFTIRRETGPPTTFLVEVVRADLKGGSDRLRQKLARYARRHHEGWLARTFGFERLRAVLVLTTSTPRVNNFAAIASGLAHGRRLFWFGCYRGEAGSGAERLALAPESILSDRWHTATGERVAFISAAAALVAARADSIPPHV